MSSLLEEAAPKPPEADTSLREPDLHVEVQILYRICMDVLVQSR